MTFLKLSKHGAVMLLIVCLSSVLMAQVSISEPSRFPILPYAPVPNFFQLPAGDNFVEVAGVAANSQGHTYIFHRGKPFRSENDA